MRCCDPAAYEDVFAERIARKDAGRYRRKGLRRSARRLVDAVRAQGVEGAEVLEIGGGVGAVGLELLTVGASRATNAELSHGYEAEAAELVRERGVEGRVTRVLGDLVASPELAGEADVVVMERVVCCYPDPDALVGAAAARARRLLVFTYPRPGVLSRGIVAFANLIQRLRGSSFRAFVHPAAVLRAAAEREGLVLAAPERGVVWRVAAFRRT